VLPPGVLRAASELGFVRVPGSVRAIQLQRAALPRLIEGDAQPPGSVLTLPNAIRAQRSLPRPVSASPVLRRAHRTDKRECWPWRE
jgi:hypothetical protein